MFDFSLNRLLFTVPAIIIALTFHEYAHARVAYAFGDSTAKEAGRLTLNPLRHLDILGTLLLIVAGFGWAKPVPVNPWLLGDNRRKKMMAVSVAVLCIVLMTILFASLLAFILASSMTSLIYD